MYLGQIQWPHVVAADEEGSWLAETGYEWANLDSDGRPIPGDLRVASTSARAEARLREHALAERWLRYLKEIQDQKDYGNWSGPPHTLYLARHPN
jgi:hypothetical protein